MNSGSSSMGPFSGVPAGGVPTKTDTILSGIFIALFFATGHFFHHRHFFTYSKKFIYSIFCFTFCMARIVALIFRILVVKHPTDITLNIIAQVLIAASVTLLFFVNLQMSRRFFGQLRPQYAVAVQYFVTFWSCLIIPIIAMVITAVVQSFLASDPHILSTDRKVRLVGSCFMVLLPFLPIPIVLVALALRARSPRGWSKKEQLPEVGDYPEANRHLSRTGSEDYDNHMTTSHRVKGEPNSGFGPTPMGNRGILKNALTILIPAALLTFEQGVRCAQAFHMSTQPGEMTPWYMTKGAFWVCIFLFELISVIIMGIAVLPRRFSHLRIV